MKRYPEYIDSGIEWIGEIPSHWNFGVMKYRLSTNDGGVWGSDIKDDTVGTIVIRSTEITIDGKWDLNNPMNRELDEKEKQKCKLNKGDIVITKSSGSPDHIGKSVIVDDQVEQMECCFSNFVQRIRFKSDLPKLYHYILNSEIVRKQYRYLTRSTTGLGNLSSTTFNSVQIPYIPYHEQTTIANFLDQKTQLIDDLISKKERLIELLQEERTAMINQAVTKGLDPNVPMKDSGIEWLGKIPEYWEVKRLKFLVNHIIDKTVPNGFKIALENIESNTGKFVLPEKPSDLTGDMNKFKIGDVLFNKLRPYLAKVFLPDQIGTCVSELLVLRPLPLIQSKFLFYRLLSKDFIDTVNGSTYGAKMPRANWEDFIRNLLIPYPTIEEQHRIVDHLENRIKKMNESIINLTQEVNLFNEYKTSLINESVTGKIDVRNYQINHVTN